MTCECQKSVKDSRKKEKDNNKKGRNPCLFCLEIRSYDQKHPKPWSLPQQHRMSKMIQILSHPLPQPSPLPKNPLPFPQQHRSNRIQMMLEHPLWPSHPHPQFVAAKSLILKSSIDLIYSSYYVVGMSVFPKKISHYFFRSGALGIAQEKILCYSTYDCV